MLIHAAANSATGTTDHTYAVALTAKDEQALIELDKTLSWQEIPHCAFRDPDWENQLMSVGIFPNDRRVVRRYLKHFSLIGENDDLETRS